MTSLKQKKELGQVIPLVVLMMFAIIAMVALIIDGGSLLSNRRTAQAAADSGALAGAKEICLGNASEAVNTANQYVTQNNGVPSNATILTDAKGIARGITITATTSNPSFFARIFNDDELEASADASAGCYSVSQAKVLPIAWSCKKPVGESDSPDCIVNMLDWKTEMEPLITGDPDPVEIHDVDDPVNTPMDFSKNYLPGYMYVVMDSPKLDQDTLYTCADPTIDLSLQPGKIDCDINNDQVNDVLGHGDRSWLDLDGGLTSAEADTSNGAKALKNWIMGIRVPTLATHTWLGGQSGVATSIFKTVNDYAKGKVALVPVYNQLCDTNPDYKQACKDAAHNGITPVPTDYPVKPSPGADYYFHIVGFSAFYITCVDDGNGKNVCPGAKQLIQDNVNEGIWDKNKKIKSIEGYFIDNYPFDIGNPGTGGVDVGVHIVSLSE